MVDEEEEVGMQETVGPLTRWQEDEWQVSSACLTVNHGPRPVWRSGTAEKGDRRRGVEYTSCNGNMLWQCENISWHQGMGGTLMQIWTDARWACHVGVCCPSKQRESGSAAITASGILLLSHQFLISLSGIELYTFFPSHHPSHTSNNTPTTRAGMTDGMKSKRRF